MGVPSSNFRIFFSLAIYVVDLDLFVSDIREITLPKMIYRLYSDKVEPDDNKFNVLAAADSEFFTRTGPR